MTLARAAVLAALAALATTVVWGLKALVIGLAGGNDRSPLEGPLFLLGLALAVATAVLLGLAAAGPRRWWWKVAGVVGAALVALLSASADAVVKAVEPQPHGWAWGEVNLWVLAVALLVATVVVDRRHRSVPDRRAPRLRVTEDRVSSP